MMKSLSAREGRLCGGSRHWRHVWRRHWPAKSGHPIWRQVGQLSDGFIRIPDRQAPTAFNTGNAHCLPNDHKNSPENWFDGWERRLMSLYGDDDVRLDLAVDGASPEAAGNGCRRGLGGFLQA